MSERVTIARPYAEAAFDYALENKALKEWSHSLESLSLIVQNELMHSLLNDPRVTSSQCADVMIDLMGDSLNDKQKNFVRVLAEFHRLSYLPEILELYVELCTEYEKSIIVNVSAVKELDEMMKANLRGALQNRLKRNVELHYSVDKSLIGGLLVRAGDTVIDASIRGKLNRLAEDLL